MASISTDKKGNRTVQFINGDKKRRSIRLGKVRMKDAKEFCGKLEDLLTSKALGRAPEAEVIEWVTRLQSKFAQKLAGFNLLPGVETSAKTAPPVVTLGQFIRDYILSRTDLKPRTILNLEAAERELVQFLSADRPLQQITSGDADEFRARISTKFADNTVRRLCGRAKQFFRAAHRKKLIADNPFADMRKCSVGANRSRDFYIPLETAKRILAACPNNEWRLLFALSRFGGLRCPSEHLGLKWEDVDFDRGRMTIRSPKTAHHQGHEFRETPIFPELRPLLEAAKRGTANAEYVISTYRGGNTNLRTQFQRILKRAEVESWPKLFQNLRASCGTDLAAKFSPHIAAAWLGHSTSIAQKHYWQITDSDFERAATAASALQIPVQQPSPPT